MTAKYTWPYANHEINFNRPEDYVYKDLPILVISAIPNSSLLSVVYTEENYSSGDLAHSFTTPGNIKLKPKPKKRLKSLEEANEGSWGGCFPHIRVKLNGIACPDCGEELYDSSPGVMLLTSPPKLNIYCQSCGYRGYRSP